MQRGRASINRSLVVREEETSAHPDVADEAVDIILLDLDVVGSRQIVAHDGAVGEFHWRSTEAKSLKCRFQLYSALILAAFVQPRTIDCKPVHVAVGIAVIHAGVGVSVRECCTNLNAHITGLDIHVKFFCAATSLDVLFWNSASFRTCCREFEQIRKEWL